MSKITNIKINYLILEQILRVTGLYKNICDEYESLHGYDFIDDIFKRAKTGDIDPLFQDDTARDIILGIIENITGVPTKYWSGEERIKLSIRCKNKDLIYDDKTIDTIDLDIPVDINGLYQGLLENPLRLSYEDIYSKVTGLEMTSELNNEDENKAMEAIESLYSLSGLIAVILLNMADEKNYLDEEDKKNVIEILDKTDVYRNPNWKPYIKSSSKATQQGINYNPKFVEIRKGLVQTIIKNIFKLNIVFTFENYLKKIDIRFPNVKRNI